jgi:hypothetical protein
MTRGAMEVQCDDRYLYKKFAKVPTIDVSSGP